MVSGAFRGDVGSDGQPLAVATGPGVGVAAFARDTVKGGERDVTVHQGEVPEEADLNIVGGQVGKRASRGDHFQKVRAIAQLEVHQGRGEVVCQDLLVAGDVH